MPFCPLMSTQARKVPCDATCALCLKVNDDLICSINLCAYDLHKLVPKEKQATDEQTQD